MQDGSAATSKERILQAAEDIFARKGFDGARVDEIARQAGVNKALLYYYFESKEGILRVLISSWIKGILSSLGDYRSVLPELLDSEDKFREYATRYLAKIEERKNLLTIIMMELLKESGSKELILQALDQEIRQELARLQELKYPGDTEQAVITEFLTGAMPIVMYVLLKQSWMKLYRMDEETLRDRFFTAFMSTHGHYTRELLQGKRSGKTGDDK